MRELTFNEVSQVNGAWDGGFSWMSDTNTAMGFGAGVGTIFGTAWRGFSTGARFGVYGAAAGLIGGVAYGIYDYGSYSNWW